MEVWVLEFSPEQQALHLRPESEGPGPGDWQELERGSQEELERLALKYEEHIKHVRW